MRRKTLLTKVEGLKAREQQGQDPFGPSTGRLASPVAVSTEASYPNWLLESENVVKTS